MNTKFIQLNKHFFECEVTGFIYYRLSETKFEMVANKQKVPFKIGKKYYKSQIVTKRIDDVHASIV